MEGTAHPFHKPQKHASDRTTSNKWFLILRPSFLVVVLSTHRLNSPLEPVYLLLQQVQRPGLAPVAGEGGGASAVDRVHPVLQLNLAWGLEKREEENGQVIIGADMEVQ